MNKTFMFAEGCIWEGPRFEIKLNVPVGEGCHRCRHAVSIDDHDPLWNRAKYEVSGQWRYPSQSIIPRVVIAQNEGGHDTTGVCLDCIIDAEKTLPH